jgi:hypothetical protein
MSESRPKRPEVFGAAQAAPHGPGRWRTLDESRQSGVRNRRGGAEWKHGRSGRKRAETLKKRRVSKFSSGAVTSARAYFGFSATKSWGHGLARSALVPF